MRWRKHILANKVKHVSRENWGIWLSFDLPLQSAKKKFFDYHTPGGERNMDPNKRDTQKKTANKHKQDKKTKHKDKEKHM